MSKLLIKQRVFSWTDTYDIYDRNGEPKYFVKADFMTLGHRIHIYSHETGQELCMIKERPFAFLAKAEIYVDGAMLGTITRRFTLFRSKYTIDYNGWSIDGDFMGWDYSIIDSRGDSVAVISKELFRWGDTYNVTTYNDEDELGALVTAITIDMMNCDNN